MNINKLDLNLLKILHVLLREKNTLRTAKILNTSQPSVSRALSKLRQELDDPLLVRESRGMKLTPKAKKIANQLPSVLAAIEGLFATHDFEPGKISRILRIALNGYLMESYGCQIYKSIKQDAPNAKVELVSYNNSTANDIISGRVDAGLN